MQPNRAATASLDTGAGRAPGADPGARPVEDYATGSGDVIALRARLRDLRRRVSFRCRPERLRKVGRCSVACRAPALHRRIGRAQRQAAARARRARPRWCSQSPVLLPWRTVLDNVLLPIELRKLPMASYRRAAVDLLRCRPERVRAALSVRALWRHAAARRDRACAGAEPAAPADGRAVRRARCDDARQMNLELIRIWSRSRKTVISITHSIAEAIFLSDRVIAMTARPGTIADGRHHRPRGRATFRSSNTDRFGRYAARLRSLLDARGGMF